MNLTNNFTLEELCESETAVRKGINNTPDNEVQQNLYLLARGLERVRSILAVPIHVSSGYRSPKLNAATGGSKNSAHMRGLACDFTAPQFGSPSEVCRKLADHKDELGFDQLIMEFGRWVHISFPDEGAPKGEILTAVMTSNGAKYVKGLA